MKPTQIAVAKPCGNCPFRWDVAPFLRLARVVEIMDEAHRGNHFVCHKTVNYDLPPGRIDPGRRACAGFMLLAYKEGLADGLQVVQLAARLVNVTFDRITGAELIYASASAMIHAHQRAERR